MKIKFNTDWNEHSLIRALDMLCCREFRMHFLETIYFKMHLDDMELFCGDSFYYWPDFFNLKDSVPEFEIALFRMLGDQTKLHFFDEWMAQFIRPYTRKINTTRWAELETILIGIASPYMVMGYLKSLELEPTPELLEILKRDKYTYCVYQRYMNEI